MCLELLPEEEKKWCASIDKWCVGGASTYLRILVSLVIACHPL